MSKLRFKDLEYYYNNNISIDWNDEYRKEWNDAIGPLTIIGLANINWMIEKSIERCGFIKYTCSNKECRYCFGDKFIKGHHKIIKLNGMDPFGRVEFTETKKKTIINIVPQPVFKKIE